MVQPEGSGASTRESPQQGRDPWLFSQRSLRIWPLGLGGGIRIGSLRCVSGDVGAVELLGTGVVARGGWAGAAQ